jgi:hypothetical protein
MTQDEIIEMARQAGILAVHTDGDGHWHQQFVALEAFAKLVAAKAIAELESQEPWCMKMNGCKTKCEDCPDKPPPQRTWVDLTRTQMQDVYFEVLKEHRGGHQIQGQLAFGEALQAKLKEKNT